MRIAFDLALMNNRITRMLEFEFDRIFNRKDMAFLGFQNAVNECGQCCGFSRSSGACAEHESSVFEEVTQARASIGRGSVGEQAAAESNMAKSLMNLFALAENYPDLKADKNFQQLQAELSDLEDVIQKARRYYNGTVRDFNTELELFPGNLIAGMFNFASAEFFELENEADAAVPEVSFSN